jgi:biopolymer transport protein TolR
MVTAPMMTEGFGVHLPQARKSSAITAPLTVTVPLSFRKDSRVRVGKEWVPLEFLAERVRQALDGQLSKDVIIAGDSALSWQDLFRLSDKLKEAGVEKVGVQSQPATSERVP